MISLYSTTPADLTRSAAYKLDRAIQALRDAEELVNDLWATEDEFDAGVAFWSSHRALELVQDRVRKLQAQTNEQVTI